MKISEFTGGLAVPERLPGVHKLKQQYRDFVMDMDCCGDWATFECLLHCNVDLLKRIEAELPDWWFGDLEPEQGLARLIELKTKELKDARERSVSL